MTAYMLRYAKEVGAVGTVEATAFLKSSRR